MAGQFGQLREKYDLSVEVARPLIDAVKALQPGSFVAASGTSCRNQLSHLAGIQPLHMAEIIARSLDNTPSATPPPSETTGSGKT